MYQFGEKHPVIFESFLTIAVFLVAIAVIIPGNILNLHPDLTSSVGRIVAGLLLLLLYRRAFTGRNPDASFAVLLPALLFAAWNLYYNLSSGASFGGAVFFTEALLTAASPAIFEEVLFRGIFLYNLKKKGHGDLASMLLSAVFFAAVHLTNLVGQELAAVALQAVYSLVIGMVLAAIYLRNNSISEVILVHFLIDYTNRLYIEPAASASALQMVLFAVLLAAEAVYALLVVRKKERSV